MSSQIRRLNIQRFRGIELLTWKPSEGLNIILGGGDVGKSTILDAIGLLLYPTNTYPLGVCRNNRQRFSTQEEREGL